MQVPITTVIVDLTCLGPQCRANGFFIHKAWVLYAYDDPTTHKSLLKTFRNNRTRQRRSRQRKNRRIEKEKAHGIADAGPEIIVLD